jgi:hypothetical protein
MAWRWIVSVVVLLVLPACGGDEDSVADSRTCAAVRHYNETLNNDDRAVMERRQDRIVNMATSERPSDYVVAMAERMGAALRQIRETPPDRVPPDENRPLIEEYQTTYDALLASCELAPGYPADYDPEDGSTPPG